MEYKLMGSVRKTKGKGSNRRLRAQGNIPAVLYGADAPPVNLFFNSNELQQALKNLEHNPIIKVEWDNQQANAILKEIQYTPISDMLLHVDLMRIAMDKVINVNVPIHLEGTAEGVKQGGILEFIIRKVEIKCLPMNIPEHLEINISNLKIGDTLEIHDLKLPEGVEIAEPVNQPILVISAPTITAVEEKAPAAAIEEAATDEVKDSKESKDAAKKES